MAPILYNLKLLTEVGSVRRLFVTVTGLSLTVGTKMSKPIKTKTKNQWLPNVCVIHKLVVYQDWFVISTNSNGVNYQKI